MRLSTMMLKPANEAMAWLWSRRSLVSAMSAATDCTIRCEALARATWRPLAEPSRPFVFWHEGGGGPALVLLNGFSGSGLAWPSTWVRRLEENHLVIRIDNRGTGWSREAPGPFTMADLAQDVCDVLDSLGVEHAAVFGLSMGGMIAQEMAIRYPARVSRLILAGTIPPIPHSVASPFGLSLAGSLFTAHGRDNADPSLAEAAAAANLWLRFAARGFQAPPELVTEMGRQAMTRATPWRGVLKQAQAIHSWRGARRLRRIAAPTVVVQGAADRVIVPENGRRLARFIPGARLMELPGVGHLVPWEAGDEMVRLIDE